jgi:ABC-type glycerol-3-phosphate transport system substrate-binding protein
MIAAVSALGMTAALGGCGAVGSGDVTLKLVAADYGDSDANSSQKYWDKLVGEYEDAHPGVKVDVSVYSWNDVDRKVKEMVAAGDAPDLAQIGAYADYAAKGDLYEADDLLSIPTQADFVAHLAEAGEVRRTQYGMPFAASTRLLFFNKKLFTAAGLTPPTTWRELASDAAALRKDGVKYPYALPLGPEEAQAETMQWLLSGGDGYTTEVGTYGIDSPQNIRTFTWLKDELVDKGLTGPVAPGKLNRAAAFAAFARGEVGMLNGHPSLMKIAAAKGVPQARAVATVAAPYDPSHVEHQYDAVVERVMAEGEAPATFGNKTLTMKREFVEDIRRAHLHEAITTLKRPLLVLHSPTDNTVGIANASEIFKAARHPRNFISLEGSDHLLTAPGQARRAARIISA